MMMMYFGFWNPDLGFHVWNPKVYGDDNVGFHQKLMDYKDMETDHYFITIYKIALFSIIFVFILLALPHST
jgi:hypothetical protein